MNVLKIASYLGAASAITAVGWFWFGHFAQAQETYKMANDTATVVKELQEIKRAEFARQQGEAELLRKLCALGYAPERDCIMAGLPYIEHADKQK